MRPSRRGILLATGAAAGTSLAVRLLADGDGPEDGLVPSGRLLRPVRSTELGLDDVLRPVRGALHTRQLDVPAYSMVAVTWRDGDPGELAVRTRTGRRWGAWQPLDRLEDLPDLRSGEGNGRAGSDLLWVGASDGVQLRTSGRARDARLVLVDPGLVSTDASLEEGPDGLALSAWTDKAPKPYIHPRRAWGADESWRTSDPRYNPTIKNVHLHHTASSNSYSEADVPAILRGMYRYHTQSLGWSDIGYNFLVDRFGRRWEGRYGGMNRPVRGAHTLGFNHNSVGIAVIGNLQSTDVTQKVITALVRLSAWKLDMYGRNPTGSVVVQSHGSDRYAAGRWVRLPVICGHRDTNLTSCPGDMLYARRREIRRRTKERVDRFS